VITATLNVDRRERTEALELVG